MNVLDVDLKNEDDIILKLDDLYTRCDQLLEKFETDYRIKQEMTGKEIVRLMSQQTDLIITYTMIIPEVCAMISIMESFLKKVACIIQKNLNQSSQKSLGDRETARLIEGDSKMVQWQQHKAQLQQYEMNFKIIQQLLISRGYTLKAILDAHINDKSEVVI